MLTELRTNPADDHQAKNVRTGARLSIDVYHLGLKKVIATIYGSEKGITIMGTAITKATKARDVASIDLKAIPSLEIWLTK